MRVTVGLHCFEHIRTTQSIVQTTCPLHIELSARKNASAGRILQAPRQGPATRFKPYSAAAPVIPCCKPLRQLRLAWASRPSICSSDSITGSWCSAGRWPAETAWRSAWAGSAGLLLEADLGGLDRRGQLPADHRQVLALEPVDLGQQRFHAAADVGAVDLVVLQVGQEPQDVHRHALAAAGQAAVDLPLVQFGPAEVVDVAWSSVRPRRAGSPSGHLLSGSRAASRARGPARRGSSLAAAIRSASSSGVMTPGGGARSGRSAAGSRWPWRGRSLGCPGAAPTGPAPKRASMAGRLCPDSASAGRRSRPACGSTFAAPRTAGKHPGPCSGWSDRSATSGTIPERPGRPWPPPEAAPRPAGVTKTVAAGCSMETVAGRRARRGSPSGSLAAGQPFAVGQLGTSRPPDFSTTSGSDPPAGDGKLEARPR